MNYVGHALVTTEILPNATDAQIFGSMAPDLVGMAGTKIVRHGEDQGLAEGVELHIATDQVFDRNRQFTELKTTFREFHEQFLPKGAARTCADAGTEMLLDGFVLEKTQAVDAYTRAMNAARNGSIPIGQLSSEPQRFVEFNLRHSKLQIPYFYQDPAVVAERLQHRLAIRNSPRLMFDESLIPEVARLFKVQQEEIGKVANPLIEQTIAGLLRGHATPRPINTGPVAQLLPGLAVSTARQNQGDINLLTPDELGSMEGGRVSAATATGRKLSKMALKQLGTHGLHDIHRGHRGDPLFPDGFVGSISHSAGWVIALAASEGSFRSVGVDIEPSDRVFKRDISQRIATYDELEDFSDFNELTPLVISSLKEAVYKALHRYASRRIGFHEVELRRTERDKAEVHIVNQDLAIAVGDSSVETVMINDFNWQTSICYVKTPY
ncbi:MAG TPA: 4'-phosphopantetheinyl transferase superfamily protein [Candidatus Saccharimonadales bacterium]|jgi:4'-phosphopantetheinyl transferase EntD